MVFLCFLFLLAIIWDWMLSVQISCNCRAVSVLQHVPQFSAKVRLCVAWKPHPFYCWIKTAENSKLGFKRSKRWKCLCKVDASLKHVGQNVGHQRYLEENYGKRVRVSFKNMNFKLYTSCSSFLISCCRTKLLYFNIQRTEKYSIAMCSYFQVSVFKDNPVRQGIDRVM